MGIGPIFQFMVTPLEIVIRSVLIYAGLMVALRVFGKREVGQFTIFDLVLILLVANAVQPAMTGPDNSLAAGLLIIATLVSLNFLVSRARERFPLIRRLLEYQPVTLAKDGKWIEKAIKHEGLDIEDCEMSLREHGLADVKGVKLAMLEGDGTISVVPVTGSNVPVRHRVRFIKR